MLNEFIEFTINNEFKSWKSVLNALSTLYPIFGFVDSLSYKRMELKTPFLCFFTEGVYTCIRHLELDALCHVNTFTYMN